MTSPLFDAAQTRDLPPWSALVSALRTAALDYAAGRIEAPARQVLALSGGVMLSMPAAAPDIAAHKLVSVCAGNRALGLPTIVGQVTALSADSGEVLCILDAPTVTARRTAGISLLGISELHGSPRAVTLLGTGSQAQAHAEGIRALFPEADLFVVGSTVERAAAFAGTWGATPVAAVPDSSDVVIALTTSRTPIYHEPARVGRLLVGVGAFTADAAEFSAQTVRGSWLTVDDPEGSRHEAGDLICAGVDWAQVRSLAQVIGQPPAPQPQLFKTVGCAAWDLAACRVARQQLGR